MATDNFNELDGILRMDGFVSSGDGFFGQPSVLDSASEVFNDMLGAKGQHTRTAFAVHRLPLNASIELCVSFAVV